MASGQGDLRFLICGLGSVGRRHLRNLMEMGEAEIALVRSGKATLPDDELPSIPVFTDLEQALDEWEPDGVLVTNPTSLHLETALPAAKRGIHLLIEKPVSHSMKGVDELLARTKDSGSRVLIGYQFRFHPGLLQARQLLEAEELGAPISATAYWGEFLPDWHPWENYRESYSARQDLGGGVILTLSHPMDYLRWLLGEVGEVSASMVVGGPLGLEVDEVAEISLRHRSEALSHIHLDYHRRPARHDLEIVCSRGVILWDGLRHHLKWRAADSEGWQEFKVEAGFERNTLFLKELLHFCAVIQGEESPACSLEEGAEVLNLSLAAIEAARSGKSIPLPLAERV